MFGDGGYGGSQHSHCECLPSDEVVPRYVTLFENFYSAYVPPERAAEVHVPGLVRNKLADGDLSASAISTIGELYLQLHKKYYNSQSTGPIKVSGEEKKRGLSVPTPPTKAPKKEL